MKSQRVSTIVRNYFAAFMGRDQASVEDIMTDDFTFTSQYDDHIDKAAYFARCWPNGEKFSAFEIRDIFESGDEAFVRYEFATQSGARFRNTEFIRTEGARIKDIEVYFGAEDGVERRAPPAVVRPLAPLQIPKPTPTGN